MKRALASLGLLAVFAAGCGGDGESALPLPPITATPPVTVSSTPIASAFPQTPQGAAEFVRFLYDQIDRAYATKDPELIRPLFASGCKSCANYLGTIERLKRDDLVVTGADTTVLGAETPGGQVGDIEVDVRKAYSGITITDKAGKVLYTEPAAAESASTVTLRRLPVSYVVVKIVRV